MYEKSWPSKKMGIGYVIISMILFVVAIFTAASDPLRYIATGIIVAVGIGFLILGILIFFGRDWHLRIDSEQLIIHSPSKSLQGEVDILISQINYIEFKSSGSGDDIITNCHIITKLGNRIQLSDNIPICANGVVDEIIKYNPFIIVKRI